MLFCNGGVRGRKSIDDVGVANASMGNEEGHTVNPAHALFFWWCPAPSYCAVGCRVVLKR